MIVITGASSGLGLEVAKLYADAGKTVVSVSRSECAHAQHNIVVDLGQTSGIDEAVRQVEALPEPIEAVINSVGVYNEELFGNISDGEVDHLLAVNVKAPLLFVSKLIERIKKDGADVLNIVSTAGTKGQKSNPLYATSKWAERGFSLSLQNDLQETGCRVITFCPGGISTKFFAKVAGEQDNRADTWMDPAALAVFIKQILDLPKGIEVTEIVINRKKSA